MIKARRLIALGVLLVAGVLFGSLIKSSPVEAVTGADWNPGYIISDSVFYNENAMSPSSIQSFLNSKVSSCDTNGTQPASDYGRSDLTHAQYAASRGWHGPPYTCLKDFRQNTPQMEASSGLCDAIVAGTNRTSSQIIYDIGKACHINPQVLVILLQKEQSLVLDTWPLNGQYEDATGFGCPDTAPCDPQYSGFFYQVYYAARQFQIYKKFPNSYNYVAGRNNNIYYNPNLSGCGSSQVYIQNQATAALYIYTPYQPNAASLANLYGTGDGCSSYGNRNFWRLFNDWFGSTVRPWDDAITARYNALSSDMKTALGAKIGTSDCFLRGGGCFQQYQGGYIVGVAATGYWESLGDIRTKWINLGVENGPMGYPTGPITAISGGGLYQQYQAGYIVGTPSTGYWESLGDIRTRWQQLGYESGSLGYPTGAVYPLRSGGYFQQYQNGYIVGSSATGWWESMGPIRDKWQQLGFENGTLGYATSALTCGLASSGCKQSYQRGTIYWTSDTGAWQVWGGIGTRYTQLSGQTSSLGYPLGPESCGYIKNNGCAQLFQNGYIVGTNSTGYWESVGGIRSKWAAFGYENGFMGYPLGPVSAAVGGGFYQLYQGGIIIGTDATGYWESLGSIRIRWGQMGYETSNLGYPTGAIYPTSTGGFFQQYQNGYIVGKSSTGYWESTGSIRTRWGALGYETGSMGYPTSQVYSTSTGGFFQVYQGGVIVGTGSTGYWENYGEIRVKWGQMGYEIGAAGYPTSGITCVSGTCTQTFQHGSISKSPSGVVTYTP